MTGAGDNMPVATAESTAPVLLAVLGMMFEQARCGTSCMSHAIMLQCTGFTQCGHHICGRSFIHSSQLKTLLGMYGDTD